MYYSEKEARRLVVKAGLDLIKNNLIARTWGNISCRIAEDEFVITPSGRAYETLKEEDLPIVKISDMSYVGPYKPSGEKGIHANAYKQKPECNFIIHTHQNYATCLSMPGVNQKIVKVVEYALPSTSFLMNKFIKAMNKYPNDNVFVLARHGAIAMSNSYESTFDLLTKLENDAKSFYDKNHFDHNEKIISKPYLDDYAQMMGFKKTNPYEDKEAVEFLIHKNTLAANASKKPIAMGLFDVLLQHTVYKLKYSKLKNK